MHVHLGFLMSTTRQLSMLSTKADWHVHILYSDASCVVQTALSSSKSEQQCARLEWQQQEGLLRMQVQQQGDALQQTHQQIAALKTGYDEQQHRMQLRHSEVRQSAANVFPA